MTFPLILLQIDRAKPLKCATKHAIDRKRHAAEYARLHKIGDRAGAAKVWPKLMAATNACLAGGV